MAGACAGAIAAWAAGMLFTQRMRSSTLRGWGLGLEVWGLRFGVWGLGFGVWGLVYLRATRSRVRSGQTREKDTCKVLQYCIAASCSAYDCKAVAGQHLEHVSLLAEQNICSHMSHAIIQHLFAPNMSAGQVHASSSTQSINMMNIIT